MSTQCFTWSELGEEWIGSLYTWSDVCILISAAGGAAPVFDYTPHVYLPPQEVIKNRLTDSQYERFIELVCDVNKIKTSERKKIKTEIKISTKEISRLYEKVSASIKMKRISREDI